MSNVPSLPSTTSGAGASGSNSSSSNSSGSNDGNSSTFTCAICMEIPLEPVVTFCGHMYCWPCLFRWMQATSGQVMSAGGPASSCPVCKSAVTTETVIPLYGRGNERSRSTNTSSSSSSSAPPNTTSSGIGSTTSRATGAGDSSNAEGGSIPARPQAQRTEATDNRHGGGGGGGGGAFETTGGGGFNNVNVHFSAGFGFFPSLFGLQFQTVGVCPPRGATAPFSPEEIHHQFLERVLLSVGMLIIFFMLFL